MKGYLLLAMFLILLSAGTNAQHFRLKKGMVEYIDTAKYPVNDSTLSKCFFSRKLDLRYPVSNDSLKYVYSDNKVELFENKNIISVLNGGGGSHGNDQWQLYFYQYDTSDVVLTKKTSLVITMYEQRYEIYYNPVLIAENADWICKPKKFHLVFYDQPQRNSPFLQGHINLRFKVQAYSDKQLLLFTNTIEVKGDFIFIRENKRLKN